MQNIFRNTPDHSLSSWLLLLIIGGYVFAGLIGFQVIGYLLVTPFFGFDVMATLEALSNPIGRPEAQIPLLLVQGVTSFGAFVLIPWWIIRKYLQMPLGSFFTIDTTNLLPLLITAITVFTFMGVNSVMIEWNMKMELPESLSKIEEMMKGMEEQMKQITEFLTDFTNPGSFLLGLLIIAVLPGIGEELLFRGLFQNVFHRIFKNPHVAIWLAAFLFGVFHFQFYGVLPRILLGALFGYLYYFSGHLGYAMIAHFVNNGFMVVALYLSQTGVIDFDVESTESPDSWVVLIFGILTTGLMILFYRYFNDKKDVAEGI